MLKKRGGERWDEEEKGWIKDEGKRQIMVTSLNMMLQFIVLSKHSKLSTLCET